MAEIRIRMVEKALLNVGTWKSVRGYTFERYGLLDSGGDSIKISSSDYTTK
jgi:hypothetical protein